ncbi:MAG TPA: hypothetical protein VNS58_17805 [Puia sp.]|nr:hypothetical protein [Puia sp.]
MKKAPEELPASALRYLLIEEVKKFIICLDYSSTEELQEMKLHLRKIFDLITEKERAELTPIIWGKNATSLGENSPKPDLLDGIRPGLSSD